MASEQEPPPPQEEEEGEQSPFVPTSSSSNMEYTSLNVDDSRVVEQRQGKPSQNILMFCHFAFKVAATLLYLFSGIFHVGYITTFVFVLILLSIDFWLVKNLSGRLLAGLRWWSVIDEETGNMVWRFEAWTPEERLVAYRSQVNLFWAGIIGQQAFWTLLLLSTVFSLKLGWFVITFVACSLNGSNLYGYVRCRMQQQSDTPGLVSRMRDAFVGLFRLSGGAYMRGTTQ